MGLPISQLNGVFEDVVERMAEYIGTPEGLFMQTDFKKGKVKRILLFLLEKELGKRKLQVKKTSIMQILGIKYATYYWMKQKTIKELSQGDDLIMKIYEDLYLDEEENIDLAL